MLLLFLFFLFPTSTFFKKMLQTKRIELGPKDSGNDHSFHQRACCLRLKKKLWKISASCSKGNKRIHCCYLVIKRRGFPGGLVVKNSPLPMQEAGV